MGAIVVPHSWASRGAAVAGGLLALQQVSWATLRAEDGAVMGTAVILASLTLLAAASLGRVNLFETRVALGLVTSVQLGLALLAVGVGFPGRERDPVTTSVVVFVLISVATLTLLLLDNRHRARSRTVRAGTRPTYAL